MSYFGKDKEALAGEIRLWRCEEVGKNNQVQLRTNFGKVLGVHFEREKEGLEHIILGEKDFGV